MNNVSGTITQAMLDATNGGDTMMLNDECRFTNRLRFNKSGVKVTGAPGHKMLVNPGIHAFEPHAHDIEIFGLEVDGLLWRAFEGFSPSRVNIHHNYFTFKKGPGPKDPSGQEWAGITWTDPSAFVESRICNNVVRSCTAWAPILGYQWQDLEIGYNEGRNIANSDIEMRFFKLLCNNNNAPGGNNTNWSHQLWLHHNYCTGLHGMMLELQGGSDYDIIEDNYFHNAVKVGSTSAGNLNCMVLSSINDRSRFMKVRRNYCDFRLPAGSIPSQWRIGIEAGGFQFEVNDNYIVGNGPNAVDSGNIAVAVNGTKATGAVHDNRQENVGTQGPANGATPTYTNNGPNVQLTWDINRPPPSAMGGTTPIPPLPTKPVVVFTVPPLVATVSGHEAVLRQPDAKYTVTPPGSVDVTVK